MSDAAGRDRRTRRRHAPAEGGESAAGGSPRADYFDPTEYADHHVRVKVDGEEVVGSAVRSPRRVTQRQADYTRKTQALAEQQRRAQFGLTLQQALENNPAGDPADSPEPSTPDQAQEARARARTGPTTRPRPRFRELRRNGCSDWEQQQADSELRTAVGVLQQRYGEDFNPQEVVGRGVQHGTHGPGERLQGDGVRPLLARASRRQRSSNRRPKRPARIDAKTQASHDPSGQRSDQRRGAGQPVRSPTIEEAFAEAKRQLGMARSPHLKEHSMPAGNVNFDSPAVDHPRQLPQDPHRQHLQVPAAAVVAHREELGAQALRRREHRRTPDLRRRPGRLVRRMGRHPDRARRKASRRPSTRGVSCSPRSPSPGSKRPRTTAKRRSSTCCGPRSCRPKRRRSRSSTRCSTPMARATRARTSSASPP